MSPKKIKKPCLSDRAMECIVCGKAFTRGPLDLARHISAVTLQHYATKKVKDGYNFHCSKCGYSFTTADHLDLHKTCSACSKGIPLIQTIDGNTNVTSVVNTEKLEEKLKSRKAAQSTPVSRLKRSSQENNEGMTNETSEEDDHVPSHSRTTTQDTLTADDYVENGDEEESGGSNHDQNSEDSSADGGEKHPGRTMECMVCGKLFPRGPIDLHRHATAVTLKHLVSHKANNYYSHSCKRCTLHFTSAEHLDLHVKYSTCNPDNVWPRHTSNMSGLRAVHKSQFEEESNKLLKTYAKTISKSSKAHPGQTKQSTRSSNNNNTKPGQNKPSASSANNRGLKRTRADTEEEEEDLNTFSAPAHLLSSATSVYSIPPLSSMLDTTNASNRTKYPPVKLLVPEDRQAFFSVVSLLVEEGRKRAGEGEGKGRGVRVTEENYEQFILPEHLPVVQKLKE